MGVGLSFSLLGASGASATSFKFKETFGSANQPGFVVPMALAVEQADGDLLIVDVEAKTISRFNADGTPDNFSALGTHVIDGKVGADKITPAPEELNFGTNPNGVQIAVDDSGGLTDGNIYVTQRGLKLIDVFDEDGTFLGKLTEFKQGPLAEGAAKELGRTAGVAVDPAGAVYVGDQNNGEIHKYMPAGGFPVSADNVANLPRANAATMAAGAAASAGFLFSINFGTELSKFDSTTGAKAYLVDAGENITVTIDPASGHLFAASSNTVKHYDASGATEAQLLGSFSPGSGISGVAVDSSSGLIYVAREGQAKIEVWEPVVTPEAVTKPATAVTDSSATLNGEVNPNGQPLTVCFFEWGTTTAYGQTAECEPDFGAVGEGSAFVPVQADIENLEAGTTYHFRMVAENANGPGEGDDEEFQTSGPSLKEQTVSGVTANGARISAKLDPNGGESSFQVEYIDEAAYLANPVSERFLGATKVPLPEREVPASVSGNGNLKEGSAIVSLVSTSAGALGAGQDITGPGIPAGTTILEILSPTELKLSKAATATIEAAALTATGPQPITQQLSGLQSQTTYHFRIVATNPSGNATGPDMAFTTFPLPGTGTLPEGRKYEMVSPSQKTGEVIPPEPVGGLGGSCNECLPGESVDTMPMQAAPDGESVLYEGQPFTGGLASGLNEYISSRGVNGWATGSLSTPIMNGRYQAFSSDFSQAIFFQADPALSPKAPTRGGKAFPNLYLRNEAGTFEPLVTVEPPEREPFLTGFRITYAGANFGAPLVPEFSHLIFEANDALTLDAPAVGAGKCAFEASECNLYEWVEGELHLVNLLPDESASTNAVIGSGRLLAQTPAHEAPTVDKAISADGTRIFFSDEATGQVYARVDGTETLEVPGPGSCKESVALTSRACFLTASADGTVVLLADGELFELNEGANEYLESADLTEGQKGFQGILGASEDLARIYFVDTADLTGAEENDNGEEAEAGKLNLYAWEKGKISFIGALLGADGAFGQQSRYGTWKGAKSGRTAQVSPRGDFLTFMSRAPLTKYDNTPSGESCGALCLEVFVYAAESKTLRCASCNPSGQRPLGQSNLSLLRPGSFGAIGDFPPYPQPGNLVEAGEGRVFFESQDALLPQDTNGKIQDVYEWVPDGVGSCEQAKGCVHLISSGKSANDSMFLDSTPSGSDAFFITRERLVSRDKDDQLDLYGARVGGGFEETPAAPCAGEACVSPIPSPPVQRGALPPFAGPGNPPAKPTCRKGFVKKKGKCVKKPKKKKKQATHKRGSSR